MTSVATPYLTHHSVEDVMTPEQALEAFRRVYPSVRVRVYDDYMTYSTSPGWADRAVLEAMRVIRENGLPLVAESSRMCRRDSFIVKYVL